MNVFKLAADLTHLLAMIILLWNIWKTGKSRSRPVFSLNLTEPVSTDELITLLRPTGISGRSQILFALVFTARYVDIFLYFYSYYNTVLKVVFICASYATLYLMYVKFKATLDRNDDTFRIEFLVIPAVILALLVNHDSSAFEILWAFSIYLESVAIVPQLFLLSKTGEVETITSHYLFCLGSYRALYILNWVYRYYSEGYFDIIAIIGGILQTVLYCDFFYLYFTKVIKGKALGLPA